ncbi:MAG: F0F1 ATP synthase subunit A [Acidobacteriaceae bacterium]|jgi:F-type H+-transporting ATPase subunit a|nr:F0F1 ATP synthase subunit A [Acidobacteriaceae bacterium]
MPEQLLLTAILNNHFAGPVDRLLAAVHVTPAYAQAPITNAFAMELLVFVVLVAFFAAIRLSLSVETPGAVQHVAEMTNEFVSDQAESIIGHGYERFVPYLAALFIFILICNLIGLIPGLESPTSSPVVPLGMALVTFIYYHFHGIRANKGGYIKQFLGPVWWLAPLMVLIEIISHLARVLSLTVRLFANIYAGDLVTLAFFSLIPLGIPLIFMGLHVFVSLLQAFVFMLLSAIYLSLAVAHDH